MGQAENNSYTGFPLVNFLSGQKTKFYRGSSLARQRTRHERKSFKKEETTFAQQAEYFFAGQRMVWRPVEFPLAACSSNHTRMRCPSRIADYVTIGGIVGILINKNKGN